MRFLRLGLRLACLGIGLAVFSVIAIQFEGILARNVALSQELSTTRAQLDALRAKKRRQLLDIARLQNPRGAIPEIHDRLKVVGPNEELIYVKGEPTAPPAGWEGDH